MGRIFGKPLPCERLGVGSGVCLAIALLIGAGPAPPSVSIDFAPASEPPPGVVANTGWPLDWEIIRQAFLLAAREELGLTTRDPVLGDPDDSASSTLELEVARVQTVKSVIRLRRKSDASRKVLWEKTYAYSFELPGDISLAALMEGESRATFPGVLKKAGLEQATRASAKQDAVATEATATRLNEMNVAFQFAAVRELHALLHVTRSPAIEGALVRGYANLSVMTEHHFAPAYDVFKARALLYSERLVAADPRSPWGLWHRAYARCLGGMHGKAEEDLDKADALLNKAPKAGGLLWTKPDWVPLIAASCRFDPVPLAAAARDPNVGQLALLLRFLAVQEPGANQLTLSAGRDVLAVRPECFRVFDGMFLVGGVGDHRLSTELALDTSRQSLRDGLVAMSDLPEEIKTQLDGENEAEDQGALLDALTRSIGGEPSWAAYAKIYREERFVETWRRLLFLRNSLGVPTEDFLNEALPEFEGHPYRPFLILYSADRSAIAAAVPQLVAALKERSDEISTFNFIPMAVEISRYDPRAGNQIYSMAMVRADRVYRDIVAVMHHRSSSRKSDAGRFLRVESPHAPASFVESVTWLKDDAEGRAKATEWEKEFAAQPIVLASLGRRYAAWKDYENSRRLFQAAIKLSPDSKTFLDLADSYRDAGDLDGWKRTLDDYLAQEPDGGLGHAQVRVKVARHFMALGEWEKAQPYAETAAESYAHFAMQCAIDCYVGMEDWDRAEVWVIRQTQRYGPVNSWYYWCLRTGHGHFVQARNTLNSGIPQGRLTVDQMGQFTEFDGSKREAFDFFQREYSARGNVGEGASYVALADDVDEIQARDRALTLMIARGDPAKNPVYQVQLALYAKLLQDTLAKGEKALFDEAAFEAVVDSARPEQRPVILYYGGRFAEKRGYPEKALALYKRALAHGNLDGYLATSATLDVRRLDKSGAPATPAAKSKSATKVQKKAPAKSKKSARIKKSGNASKRDNVGE